MDCQAVVLLIFLLLTHDVTLVSHVYTSSSQHLLNDMYIMSQTGKQMPCSVDSIIRVLFATNELDYFMSTPF